MERRKLKDEKKRVKEAEKAEKEKIQADRKKDKSKLKANSIQVCSLVYEKMVWCHQFEMLLVQNTSSLKHF